MPAKKIDLDYRGPFRLRYHYEGSSARRSFWWDGHPIVIELTQSHDNGPVHAEAFSDLALSRDAIRAAARHMIAADDDLGDFHSAVARDTHIIKLIDALPGLKPMRMPDLWTTLLRSVISQQISTAAARAIREKLARRYGRIVDVRGEEVSVVPGPTTLCKLRIAELAEVGLSGRKAEYALGLAEAFLDGRIMEAELRQATPEEMILTLSALRGVGIWTAECVGIFCLGHRDLLPADDLGIQQGVQQLYGLSKAPRPKELRKLGEKWAGWRSYASIYLWGGRNHGVLPSTKGKQKRAATKVPTRPDRKAPKLPPVKTGAKHHTPVAPGRRGR